MYVDILLSNTFNLNKHFFFLLSFLLAFFLCCFVIFISAVFIRILFPPLAHWNMKNEIKGKGNMIKVQRVRNKEIPLAQLRLMPP